MLVFNNSSPGSPVIYAAVTPLKEKLATWGYYSNLISINLFHNTWSFIIAVSGLTTITIELSPFSSSSKAKGRAP